MPNTECRILTVVKQVSNLNKTALPIFIGIALLFLCPLTNSANAIPTAEDINRLAETAKLTVDTFMQDSFKLRMGYEYSGRFSDPNDKENLRRLAQKASDRLQTIADEQRKLKEQIEDYQGDDWDARYGSTGLWRKLSADIYTTKLSKCEVDYYLAMASRQPQRNNILHKILTEIDSLNLTHLPATSGLLKAKTLALLSQTEPVYKSLAKKEFDALMVRSDMNHSTAFRIAIERIKLLGEREPGQLKKLMEAIAKSRCKDDFELVLSLAFLQRQLNQPEVFERTAKLFPQIQDFLGSLILSDISSRIAQQQSLQPISVFEAELAVETVWKNRTEDHSKLLDYLSTTEKFQTPLILYVAAVKSADSSPARAVDYLMKASKLQEAQKSDRLDIEPDKIAEQAAQLAYNLLAQDTTHCPLTLRAFENYSAIAGKKIDEELEYLYTIVLNNCGCEEKSTALLEKIANRPAGSRRNRARLDLIIQTIRQGNLHKKQYHALCRRLNELIADCPGKNETDSRLRAEAITIYCRLLLESEYENASQKVLDILNKAETDYDPNLNVLKSTALRRTGKLDESVRCLLKAIKPGCCDYAGEAMELLLEVTEKIDRFEKDLSFMKSCKKLAQFCCDCLEGQLKQRAGLFLIETSVFSATKTEKELSGFEQMLHNIAKAGFSNDIDFIRCRARVLAEEGKFQKAAELWSEICAVRKEESASSNSRSWKWWRAKFYELACLAKWPQTNKQQLRHTIEILENSFTDIPPLWSEKLSLLKQTRKTPSETGG